MAEHVYIVVMLVTRQIKPNNIISIYLNKRTAVCAPSSSPAASSQICTLYKNSYNSAIFQARRLKFCMVVDLDLLYIYLASVYTSASSSTSTSALEVNILNSHNLLIFQARRLKFFIVVDLDLH